MVFTLGGKKAQGGPEYIFLLASLIVLAVFVLSNAFKQTELNIAIASARSAGEQVAMENGASLHNVTYWLVPPQNGGLETVYIQPFFSQGFAGSDFVRQRVKSTIAPNSPFDSNGCFATTRRYCVI